MAELTRFQIQGLFGSHDVDLDVSGPALIIVGPNGLGKSNAASIFYLFTTRQWSRLVDHSFESIIAHFDDVSHRLSKQDIMGISELSDLLFDKRLSPRMRHSLSRLKDAGELESFLQFSTISPLERKRLSSLIEMPSSEVIRMQAFLRSRIASGEEFQSPSKDAISQLLGASTGRRSIYLPTYRRIEKELKQIFPDLEERVRYAEDRSRLPKAEGYVDLVSFGMEDVKGAINDRLETLRNYSLVQFNSLSGTYLRDVIRGRATEFNMAQIRALDDSTLADVLGRVSEATLSSDDKGLLRGRIQTIRKTKRKQDIELNDQYLVHYFSRLMDIYEELRARESDIVEFVDVCNEYLNPSKHLIFNDVSLSVSVVDSKGLNLDLSHLSSGEKQIVSIFAHLYLDGATKNTVIIDEPELSLSVPWQKRFLPDLLNSGRCDFVFAVTHSPFIYQNELQDYAEDFRKLTS